MARLRVNNAAFLPKRHPDGEAYAATRSNTLRQGKTVCS